MIVQQSNPQDTLEKSYLWSVEMIEYMLISSMHIIQIEICMHTYIHIYIYIYIFEFVVAQEILAPLKLCGKLDARPPSKRKFPSQCVWGRGKIFCPIW